MSSCLSYWFVYLLCWEDSSLVYHFCKYFPYLPFSSVCGIAPIFVFNFCVADSSPLFHLFSFLALSASIGKAREASVHKSKKPSWAWTPQPRNPLGLQGREERCGLHSKEHIPAQTTKGKTGPQEEEEELGLGFRGRKPVTQVLESVIQVARAAGAQMTHRVKVTARFPEKRKLSLTNWVGLRSCLASSPNPAWILNPLHGL